MHNLALTVILADQRRRQCRVALSPAGPLDSAAAYDSPVLAIRVRTRRLQSACLVMIVSRVPAADPPAIAPAGARSMNEHGARTPGTRLLIQVQSRSRGSNSLRHFHAMSNK